MSIKFKFDENKGIAALLYIAQKLIDNGKKADIHKISKILYFADEKHLSRYARPITGDYYVAMVNGAVPSNIYDIVKIVRGDSLCGDPGRYNRFFTIEIDPKINKKIIITPLQEADIEELSESDIECLDESIKENKNLGFNKLSDKCHERSAYKKAMLNNEISLLNMAQDAGTNHSTMKLIIEHAEIESIFA